MAEKFLADLLHYAACFSVTAILMFAVYCFFLILLIFLRFLCHDIAYSIMPPRSKNALPACPDVPWSRMEQC